MFKHVFRYQGNESMHGIRKYLVSSLNSRKEKYLTISPSSEGTLPQYSIDSIWSDDTTLHFGSLNISNQFIIFWFPHARFALTHMHLLFHGGPSQPTKMKFQASNDNITYDDILDINRQPNTNSLENFPTDEVNISYRYYKLQQIGKNDMNEWFFNIACFDFYGVYFPFQCSSQRNRQLYFSPLFYLFVTKLS